MLQRRSTASSSRCTASTSWHKWATPRYPARSERSPPELSPPSGFLGVRVVERREDRVPLREVPLHLREVDLELLALSDLAVGPDEAARFDDSHVVLFTADGIRERGHPVLGHALDRDA